ncbi:MAG: type III secretion chaperone [Rhabdochlamydiaceae bacterium]|nr:type III secretion chaperone [Rhabdochlamydiaceae bacterium]
MSYINWLEILGWNLEELEDIRFVGYAYIKQGRYDIAISFFEALVILSENDAYDLQTLGALYLEQGNSFAALNYLEKAVKVDPHHGPTLLNRSKALFALGYKKQALLQAKALESHSIPEIAGQASALILAHS